MTLIGVWWTVEHPAVPGTEHGSCLVFAVTQAQDSGVRRLNLGDTHVVSSSSLCGLTCTAPASQEPMHPMALSLRCKGTFIFLIKKVIHAQLRLYI